MCRSKKSTEVLHSVSSPRTLQSSPNNNQFLHNANTHTHTTSPSSGNYNDSYYYPSTSSLSSISLSNFKDSIFSTDTPTIYPFSEIQAATGNLLSKPFSSSTSSTSWLCHLRGREVILFQRRRLRWVPLDLPELQLKLSSLCRNHHGSLVKLLGASVSGDYVYLVYDYVKGGANLATCLRNPHGNYTVLSTWLSRIKVATDVAHGLDYIHHHSVGCSVHNHLKSSSVIVTLETLNGVMCHFGAAELCGEAKEGDGRGGRLGRSGSGRMKIEGTKGYMAPEFLVSGLVTKRCDVYAFGVVVLELVSGEGALRYVFDEGSGGYRRVSVIEGAKEAALGGKGGVRKWVDRRLKDSYPVDAVEKMVLLGLECVEEDPEKRPEMGLVAGKVSKLYIESMKWADQIALLTDFSVTVAPR